MKVLHDCGEILRREPQTHNDGATDYVITVFDPGGNQLLCFDALLLI
jgi:hypothetical protein